MFAGAAIVSPWLACIRCLLALCVCVNGMLHDELTPSVRRLSSIATCVAPAPTCTTTSTLAPIVTGVFTGGEGLSSELPWKVRKRIIKKWKINHKEREFARPNVKFYCYRYKLLPAPLHISEYVHSLPIVKINRTSHPEDCFPKLLRLTLRCQT